MNLKSMHELLNSMNAMASSCGTKGPTTRKKAAKEELNHRVVIAAVAAPLVAHQAVHPHHLVTHLSIVSMAHKGGTQGHQHQEWLMNILVRKVEAIEKEVAVGKEMIRQAELAHE